MYLSIFLRFLIPFRSSKEENLTTLLYREPEKIFSFHQLKDNTF
jgi:hypothetical protein